MKGTKLLSRSAKALIVYPWVRKTYDYTKQFFKRLHDLFACIQKQYYLDTIKIARMTLNGGDTNMIDQIQAWYMKTWKP